MLNHLSKMNSISHVHRNISIIHIIRYFNYIQKPNVTRSPYRFYNAQTFHANLFLSQYYASTKQRSTEKCRSTYKRQFLRVTSGTRLRRSKNV